jgi:hypothetical protein
LVLEESLIVLLVDLLLLVLEIFFILLFVFGSFHLFLIIVLFLLGVIELILKLLVIVILGRLLSLKEVCNLSLVHLHFHALVEVVHDLVIAVRKELLRLLVTLVTEDVLLSLVFFGFVFLSSPLPSLASLFLYFV